MAVAGALRRSSHLDPPLVMVDRGANLSSQGSFATPRWNRRLALRRERVSRCGQPDLRALLLRPAIELLDHAPGPLGIDLTGGIFSFPQHHVSPLVDQSVSLGF